MFDIVTVAESSSYVPNHARVEQELFISIGVFVLSVIQGYLDKMLQEKSVML
jgi:hypothetical protein